jgi:glycosyltransferase involved in cell wall biosynthesis
MSPIAAERDTGVTRPAANPPAVELTILMPCLNEAETLERCIVKARRYLDEQRINGEIVIADNGSKDGSQDIARRNGARVVDVPIRGYGAALYYGSLAAQGRYVIMGDSDDSYDFSRLEPFVGKLREGYDLVMGNRFLGGIAPGAMPWKNRNIGNPVLSGIGRLFFPSPIRDFHCGLRGYSLAAFKKMNLHTTGMEFASEMVIKSQLLGLRIGEVPTTLDKDGRSRPPHLRPWRDGWRHLRFMLLYCPRWLFWYPGWSLIIAGTVLLTLILRQPLVVGGVNFDVNSLLFAALAMILGYQSLTFGAISRKLAVKIGVLPRSGSVERFERVFNLERLLILGALVFLAGVAGILVAIGIWRQQGFGHLQPSSMLRVTIPSTLACVLGAQTMLFAFVLSIIDLGVRPDAPADRA